jgi:HAE1 family hydrophobic/amphiphilic exporter-1
VKDPIIEKVDPDASPILQLVVSGNQGPKALYHIADTEIKERLQRIRDVGAITIKGGRDRKLWLWLDQDRLRSMNLTVQDVKNALASQHVEMPGGRIEQPNREYVTRLKAEFGSAEQLDQLVVGRNGNSVIHLRDVGRTEDGLEEERSYTELDDNPCLTLEIQRQSGKNTVQVASDVKAEIAKLKKELEPRGVKLQLAVDMSTYIRQSVDQVFHHLIIGGLLAVFTVMIFLLNFRSTFISAMVLPTSIMATFIMLAFMGYTLNFMTLMALTLAIGLLIDDAIVVQENIMRHVQEGKPASFAAEFATKEIGLAVLATTLSVVAVFVPTAYTKGIVGRFFAPFGMTIAFSVLISMMVSFTLDPMLSSRMLKRKERERGLFRMLEESFMAMERWYERLLGVCLRHRGKVIVAAVIAFVAALGMGKLAKSEFIPQEDRSEFMVAMRGPLGDSLGQTRKIVEQIKTTIRAVPEVKYQLVTVGGDKTNEGIIYVRLHEKAQRLSEGQRSQRQVMDLLRERLAEVAKRNHAVIGVQLFDAIAASSGMKAAQVQLELLGSDLGVLDGISKQVLEKLRTAGGYKDLDTTYQPGKPEVSIYVNRERAASLGVSPLAIADTIRSAIGGVDIGKFRAGKDRYDISVRMLESGRDQAEKILDLTVPGANGAPVTLRNVAYIAPTSLPVEINRYNRQRQITVLANTQEPKSLGDAVGEIEAMFKPGKNGEAAQVVLPAGYHTAWSGQAEMMGESFANLAFTMLLSVIGV